MVFSILHKNDKLMETLPLLLIDVLKGVEDDPPLEPGNTEEAVIIVGMLLLWGYSLGR